MSQDIIQANYDNLAVVARRFGDHARLIVELRSRVLRTAQALEHGGWQGRGSAAFFAEMNGVLYPATQRLIQALEEGRVVTLQASEIMRRAEEEAARAFKSSGANGNGARGGSKEQDGGWWNNWGEWVHGALDGLGFIPGLGEIADGANALIYLAEGRHLEAGISAAAMIPIIGDAGKVGKWGVKAGKEILEGVVEQGGERIAKEAVETGAERAAREQAAKEAAEKAAGLSFSRSQLQHAYKHAGDFGVSGNPNNKTLEAFKSAIETHVAAPGTKAIAGEYRGLKGVTHFVDPTTGLNVIRDASGNFLSGWKLSPQQLQHVLSSGKLGGG